ncbi:MAG: hypothetical protein ABR98_02590 [Cryomorphaceae bacterium BACL7 MAG-120910-bin2]|jgi:hypothetical protein|nr:MAG: hypothetical protein ABR98_02590 [Cryomorphaceae bacterium BACL7 MAG-120910-bin2]KRO68885.1 MAG: hypothetical protein ABR88_03850 [Cryomorphaceae bacterium BACL7 MAG-120322-bin74]KRO82778.1 MAG: hypothetical protein ABR87_06815 [Cryomorphaceae bacterium BACL7 MAG-121220-bin83]NQW25276.1 T9SS type A sorting domain-containing protein [Cryomorphaceae bacterium]
MCPLRMALMALLGLTGMVLQGQPLEALNMARMGVLQTATKSNKTIDTLVPPFVDGFAHRLHPAWQSSGVITASHWSKDPLSLGVAVLDGIAGDGQAYDPGMLTNDSLTDALVSPFFNLNGQINGVLSFYLQEGGWGDPTEMADSLIVHFWNPLDSVWEHVWGQPGGASNDTWKAISIAMPGHLNGQNGVRFRIARYGSPGGAFDHFLLDYLEFGMARTLADTALFDPAWSRAPSSLLQGYAELPWWHYSAFLLERDSLSTAYRRNGPVPVGGWQLNLGKYQWTDGQGSVLASRSNVPVVTTLNHNVSTPYPFSLTKPGVLMQGPMDYHFTGWFDGENVGELANDTFYVDQTFDHRYGWDDGSAERTYGVSQGNLPRLAQKFQFLQADTLTGVDLSFVPAGFDWTGMTFQLGIWYVDTAGLPGNLLYLTDSAYIPALPYAKEPFRHYVLDTAGVFVPKEVFVGLIQTTGPALTLGLDTQTEGEKAYGDYAGWFPSLLPGTLMMRPFFRGIPKDLSAAAEPIKVFHAWPNPAGDIVQGYGPSGRVTIYSSVGQKKATFAAPEGTWSLDLSTWPAGLYIVQHDTGTRFTFMKQP